MYGTGREPQTGEPLAQYGVTYEPDRRHLRDVTPRQLFEPQYRSSQLPLSELSDGEWLKVVRHPQFGTRRTIRGTRHQRAVLFSG